MKKVLWILLFLFIHFLTFSQSEIDSNGEIKNGNFNISFDVGILQLSDSSLTARFKSRYAFQYNIGIEIGKRKSDFLFITRFGRAYLSNVIQVPELDTLGNETGNLIGQEISAYRNRLAFGVLGKERISQNSFITLSTSILILTTNAELNNFLATSAPGFLIELGYLYNSKGRLNYFIKSGFEYSKFRRRGVLNDWSGLNLCTGLIYKIPIVMK